MNAYTGAYGVVVVFPRFTERAQQLSLQTFPRGSVDYRVGNTLNLGEEAYKAEAHVTLYHAKFRDLPETVVQRHLQEMNLEWRDLVARPAQLEVYGGKFLFANIHRDQPWVGAHYASLFLSQYLDRSVEAAASDEGLEMSPEEVDNLEQFGHPLVRTLYKPHFTLAYSSTGLPKLVPRRWQHPFVLTGAKLAFAEIGEYGSVRRVIL